MEKAWKRGMIYGICTCGQLIGDGQTWGQQDTPAESNTYQRASDLNIFFGAIQATSSIHK
jgi:hypothetical protein